MTNPWLSKLRDIPDEELERIAYARDNRSGDTPIEAILTAHALWLERRKARGCYDDER